MRQESNYRIFFAIDLPAALKDRVSEIMLKIRDRVKSHALRLCHPTHLHITLQFLANIKVEDIPHLSQKIHHALATFPAFTVRLNHLELFPTPYRPRVISMALEPQDKLSILSQMIGEKIKETNYPVETRAFRGHLTLARIQKPVAIELFSYPPLPTFSAQEIILFRSMPTKEGSNYIPLERFSLSG